MGNGALGDTSRETPPHSEGNFGILTAFSYSYSYLAAGGARTRRSARSDSLSFTKIIPSDMSSSMSSPFEHSRSTNNYFSGSFRLRGLRCCLRGRYDEDVHTNQLLFDVMFPWVRLLHRCVYLIQASTERREKQSDDSLQLRSM